MQQFYLGALLPVSVALIVVGVYFVTQSEAAYAAVGLGFGIVGLGVWALLRKLGKRSGT